MAAPCFFIQMTIKQDYCFILQLKIKKHLTVAAFLKKFIILINGKKFKVCTKCDKAILLKLRIYINTISNFS